MEDRFLEKVRNNGPNPGRGLGLCWIYEGTNVIAYPRSHVLKEAGERHKVSVSRYAYALHTGQVDDRGHVSMGDTLVVRHKCDNGHLLCVNPDHLEEGTQADNVADMYARGRVSGVMTHERLAVLRKAYSLGLSQKELALLLDRGQPQISTWINNSFHCER